MEQTCSSSHNSSIGSQPSLSKSRDSHDFFSTASGMSGTCSFEATYVGGAGFMAADHT